MRLISCHIENFGILSNEDYSFDPGLNIILRDNGTGKSTLAAFIRIMLFGFENEKSRNGLEKERRRYEPWQGGIYGGSLRFETGGKEYIVERTFGKTPKTDKFSLRNGATNLESQDFSSQVGQELFDIDSASFLRTVFISQNDCAASTTDGINAKLGSLTGQTDDMDRFEHADAALGSMMTSLRSSRRAGELDGLSDEIAELEQSVRRGAEVDAMLNEKQSEMNREKDRIDKLEYHQSALREKQDRANSVNALIDLREKYDRLKADYESRRTSLEASKSVFPSAPPEEAELRQAESAREHLAELETEAARLSLSPAEEADLDRLDIRFYGGAPEPEEIEKKIDLWKKLDSLRSEIDGLRAGISVSEPMSKKPSLPLMAVGAILVLVGLIAAAAGYTVGLIASAIGLAIAAAVFLPLFLPNGNASKTSAVLNFALEEKEAAASSVESELFAYINSFGLDTNNIPSSLYELKADASNYRRLLEKRQAFEEQSPAEEILRLRTEIDNFITRCCRPEDEKTLADIRRRLSDYTHSLEEFDKARRALEDFEGKESPDALMSVRLEDRTDTGALIDELRRISDDRRALEGSLTAIKRELEDLREKRDKIDGDAKKLADSKVKLSAGETRYRILNETRLMLRQAKENMVSKYIGPLTEGFRKYYALMGGEDPQAFELDADIVLGVREAGLKRALSFLSPGRRDLAGICLRMALIDAMYRDEKPFVIFDDPFVNLDEARTFGGMLFLRTLAEQHQILYFTCHPSRT